MNHSDNETIALLIELIKRPSVTPEDHGCQQYIADRLGRYGLSAEIMNANGVTNTWLRKGHEAPLLVFAGHTDVVPTGDLDKWTTPPFEAAIKDGYLIGRGAADMKGGVAAMVTAIERFLSKHDTHKGSIAMLLTSDEEGPATHGTKEVMDRLTARGERIDYCIVGEPSSETALGDTIRVGRRGSLGATLIVRGIQGHVAYPHLADNPVHRALAALDELTKIQWDQGNQHFPATSLQISNINAGTGASNVIPGELTVDFNIRYSPEVTIETIKTTVHALFQQHQLDFSCNWNDSAHPFMTAKGELIDALQHAIHQELGQNAILDTGGGTSDGRFIAPTGAQVVEFGPINATIHQIDECVSCEDVTKTSIIYETVLKQLLT